MSDVIRHVTDLDSADRQALEHLLGARLHEGQSLLIRVLPATEDREERPHAAESGGPLPEWCNVYEGLSDNTISDLEQVILKRAELSRPSE